MSDRRKISIEWPIPFDWEKGEPLDVRLKENDDGSLPAGYVITRPKDRKKKGRPDPLVFVDTGMMASFILWWFS